MNTEKLAMFYLRTQGFQKLTFSKVHSKENVSKYILQNTITIPPVKEEITVKFGDITTISIQTKTKRKTYKLSNKNIDEEWLSMPDEKFQKLTYKDLYKYFMLFPYLIENKKKSISIKMITSEIKEININDISELVLIREFCSPAISELTGIEEDKNFFKITFSQFIFAHFVSNYHYKINETIFRSYITGVLIEKTLDILESPHYLKYKLIVPRELLQEFLMVKEIKRGYIANIFMGDAVYEMASRIEPKKMHIIKSRRLVEKFILL